MSEEREKCSFSPLHNLERLDPERGPDVTGREQKLPNPGCLMVIKMHRKNYSMRKTSKPSV